MLSLKNIYLQSNQKRKEMKDIVESIMLCKSDDGDTILKAKVFENGFAILKRNCGGVLVCCWEIDDEYNEECHEDGLYIYNSL